METRTASIVAELRSAGGQVQALYLTGLPKTGKLTILASSQYPSICRPHGRAVT